MGQSQSLGLMPNLPNDACGRGDLKIEDCKNRSEKYEVKLFKIKKPNHQAWNDHGWF